MQRAAAAYFQTSARAQAAGKAEAEAEAGWKQSCAQQVSYESFLFLQYLRPVKVRDSIGSDWKVDQLVGLCTRTGCEDDEKTHRMDIQNRINKNNYLGSHGRTHTHTRCTTTHERTHTLHRTPHNINDRYLLIFFIKKKANFATGGWSGGVVGARAGGSGVGSGALVN